MITVPDSAVKQLQYLLLKAPHHEEKKLCADFADFRNFGRGKTRFEQRERRVPNPGTPAQPQGSLNNGRYAQSISLS